MFPNKFNVYLHDTPSRELFKENVRTFSSGCIRIEKPIEFAEYLLRGNGKWTREKILSVIENSATMTVPLPEPIPIYLLYWTAWVEEDGSLHLHDDIYGRDKLLSNALQESPPSS
jgi:murein L,D-transpeptidase YcbB/YkuD